MNDSHKLSQIEHDKALTRRKVVAVNPRKSFEDQYKSFADRFNSFTKDELTEEFCIPDQSGREKMEGLREAACSFSNLTDKVKALYYKAVKLFKVCIINLTSSRNSGLSS